MIDGRTVLAVVPARGGSKGLPGKNVLNVCGKPLIAWTIEAARASRVIDRAILSTEDEGIAAIARQWDCEVPFRRPDALATDEASIYDVLTHALDELGETYDFLVLLQPTSPLRTAADIDACVEICHATGAPACVTVTEAAKSPFWMYWLDGETRMTPVLGDGPGAQRRQDQATAYALNGAVYAARTDWFRKHRTFADPMTRAFVMPWERSVDIDGPRDLALLRALFNEAPQTNNTGV